MSKGLFITTAVLLILVVGSIGQGPLPPNLSVLDSYLTDTAYSQVNKIQTRILASKVTSVICVGIQYQGTKFDLFVGSYVGLTLTMTKKGSLSSNVQDFFIADRGTTDCEHVVLRTDGGFTSDFGTSVSNALGSLGPKRIAMSLKNYFDLASDRMIYVINATGITAYNKITQSIEWSWTDVNNFNSISVANNGINSFGILLGVESGGGPSNTAQKLLSSGGTYSVNGGTSSGARAPYYTAMTDGTLVYCYDNGATIATTGSVSCGTSAASAAPDKVVANNGLYISVQVSPVQSSVVAMTTAVSNTVNRYRLMTLSSSDLSMIDTWDGPQIYPSSPFIQVSSHSSNNLIVVAYTDTLSFINVTLFQYSYTAAPQFIPSPPPVIAPFATPTATPITTPVSNPSPPSATPTTTAPIASPLASPTAVPIDGPIAPVSGPSTVSSPVKSPASNAPSQAGGVPTAPGPSPSDNVGGTPQAQPDIGTIVGVVVACVVGLGVGVFLLVFFLKKKQRKQKKKGNDDDKIDEVPMTATSDDLETYGNIPGLAPNNKYSAMTSGAGPSSDDGIVPANIQPSEIDKRLHIPHRSLVFVKEIGAGSYGKVYLGEWRGAKVAIKVNNTITDVDGFLAEAKLTLGIPPHPNLVQTFGVSLDGPNPCIVLEYCGGGSLDQLFKAENGLTNEKRVDYALKIAYGLAHLHSRSIVHRDLAARNILLTNDGQPKISDFGMSRIVQEEAAKGRTKTNVGPIRWMAPESLQDRSYSLKTDVWTYGVMLFEIVSGKEPHEDEDQFEIALKIRDKGFTPEIPEDCDPVLRECMEMCWKRLPADRPTMEDVCDFLRSKTE